VQAKGFSPESRHVTLKPDVPPVEFRRERGHTLRGRVVDPQGQPVADASIEVDKWRRATS
jgi:protocatechuate 3,4-dioxygenase beta subunit